MARSPRHPPKLYTTLAGFVEAGESLEQAVVREVFEETGVHVDPTSIQYWSSQPCDRIPSTTPGAEPPRDAKDSGSARSHSMHLETSSSNRP